MNDNDTNRESWEDTQVRPKEKTIRERFAEKGINIVPNPDLSKFNDDAAQQIRWAFHEDKKPIRGLNAKDPVIDFSYTSHFSKEKDSRHTAGKINVLLAEIQKLTEESRLIRGQKEVFLKLVEEMGEYSSAKLGDKPVKESCRQELVDIIITAISLFFLEGGNLGMLADYGIFKLERARKKIFPSEVK